MGLNEALVESMKRAFSQKTNEELLSILKEEKVDSYSRERKFTIEEILKEREAAKTPTTSAPGENQKEFNRLPKFPSPDFGYVSGYGTARSLSNLVVSLGWIVVGIGVLLSAFIVMNSLKSRMGIYSLAAILPGLGTTAGGLVMVMSGQITKATLDSADNTGRILNMFRKLSE